MKYEIVSKIEKLSVKNRQQVIREFLDEQYDYYCKLDAKRLKEALLSELNFAERGYLKSCRFFKMEINAGDICYIDFGKAFLQEIGYQHFGLVLKVFNGKAFVIPMTSNNQAYQDTLDTRKNSDGLSHITRLGKIEGMDKYSVLFLNDGKYINTARIIDIKAHIDVNSDLFQSIVLQFIKHLL